MSHGGPPLYRCAGCGCPVVDHAVDDEERRECTQCECRQYLAGPPCAASCGYCVGQRLERRDDTWPLNLAANLAAAGMAAAIYDGFDDDCSRPDCSCWYACLVRTMREAEVERMRAVVEAARACRCWHGHGCTLLALDAAKEGER